MASERAVSTARQLNDSCHCVQFAPDQLSKLVDQRARGAVVPEQMFADVPVFVAKADVRQMLRFVRLYERLSGRPDWVDAVTAGAPDIARQASPLRSVFLSYDFHVAESGPKLIEINTNAGGSVLAAYHRHALTSEAPCVPSTSVGLERQERRWVEMFAAELAEGGRGRGPSTIAIVDEKPTQQFLHAEFVLLRATLERHGFHVLIADPSELIRDGDQLRVAGKPIDLVYNRLTDFYLARDAHQVLRQAYADDAALLSPNPYHHALYASKRNLALLTDQNVQSALGLTPAERHLVQAVLPQTVLVEREHADRWWPIRRDWYFKPSDGFASRGVYDGRKLTRTRFGSVLDGDYLAQARVAPSERSVPGADGQPTKMKADVRLVTYAGRPQQIMARLYRGQTTNMRTPDGGLAAVVLV